MHRSRHRLSPIARAAIVLAAALAMVAGPFAIPAASAWANNGDNYGTHDWILDQALRVMGGAPAWLNRSVAMAATDDPDTVEKVGDPFLGHWHVYKQKGRRGGGPSAVMLRYEQAAAAYQAGIAAKQAGDAAGARTAFDEASRMVGLLAHYEGDLAQPFHTAYAATEDKQLHNRYEKLVAPGMRSITARPEWQSRATSVSPSTDVRKTAIGTAAYSRARYPELRRHLADHPDRLDARASELTGQVLRRATNDLARIISAIPGHTGAGPAVSISIDVREHWIAADRGELVTIRATDPAGRGVEGIMFVARIPDRDGGTHREHWTTDASGDAHFYWKVKGLQKGVKYTVPITTTLGATTISLPQWFMVTPALAVFRLRVSDDPVEAGFPITARAVAKTASGRRVANLSVRFIWSDGARTTAVTNDSGVATSTRTISTPGSMTLKARTRSGSRAYRTIVSFQQR